MMPRLLAEFADAGVLSDTAQALRHAGLDDVECYTPSPPELETGRSRLPAVILLAGVGGFAAAFAMQWYATTLSYRLDIGGRPYFSWPAYVPLAFEFGVLCAVAGGVIGFLVACRLPALYDPLDELQGFRRASRDGLFLTVRGAGAAEQARARRLLDQSGAVSVLDVPE